MLRGVEALDARRFAERRPITPIRPGLHSVEIFYGDIGSDDRLDITVVGPAKNDAGGIVARCRLPVEAHIVGASDNRSRGISWKLEMVAEPQRRRRDIFVEDPACKSQAPSGAALSDGMRPCNQSGGYGLMMSLLAELRDHFAPGSTTMSPLTGLDCGIADDFELCRMHRYSRELETVGTAAP